MAKIVSLRGTSGSGKSTVAYALLNGCPKEDILGADGKVQGYRVDAARYGLHTPVCIIGRYTTVCGGLDTVPTQLEAAERSLTAHRKGWHVLAEGLLSSAAGLGGAFTRAIYDSGDAVFAILDTPLEVCLARVQGRRAARGDDRPFNPKNTIAKYEQTHSTAASLRVAGCDVRNIDHLNAVEQVLDIYRQAECVYA